MRKRTVLLGCMLLTCSLVSPATGWALPGCGEGETANSPGPGGLLGFSTGSADFRTETLLAKEQFTPAVTPVPTAPAVARVHRVRSGDSLWRIAKRQCGDASYWKTIARENRIRPSGYVIRPGQELRLSCADPSAPKRVGPLAAPVETSAVFARSGVVPFGACRIDPRSGALVSSTGVDLPLRAGESVRVVAPGVLDRVHSQPDGSYSLRVLHMDGSSSRYAGLAADPRRCPSFATGRRTLERGEILGQAAAGLHFELRDPEGLPVDPSGLLGLEGIPEEEQGCAFPALVRKVTEPGDVDAVAARQILREAGHYVELRSWAPHLPLATNLKRSRGETAPRERLEERFDHVLVKLAEGKLPRRSRRRAWMAAHRQAPLAAPEMRLWIFQEFRAYRQARERWSQVADAGRTGAHVALYAGWLEAAAKHIQLIDAAHAPAILRGLVATESSEVHWESAPEHGIHMRPRVSDHSAVGFGQLLPSTAREMGVNPYDPEENLRGTALYLDLLVDRVMDRWTYGKNSRGWGISTRRKEWKPLTHTLGQHLRGGSLSVLLAALGRYKGSANMSDETLGHAKQVWGAAQVLLAGGDPISREGRAERESLVTSRLSSTTPDRVIAWLKRRLERARNRRGRA